QQLLRHHAESQFQWRQDSLWQIENRVQPVSQVGLHRGSQRHLGPPRPTRLDCPPCLKTLPAHPLLQRILGCHRCRGPTSCRVDILGTDKKRAVSRILEGLTEAGVSTGITCVLEARDLIVTPLLKVIMPRRGRIDVSGRTGSIDVGKRKEEKKSGIILLTRALL